MAEAIVLAVSKIGAVLLDEKVSTVIDKLSKRVTFLKEFPPKIKRIEMELRIMNNVIQDLGTTYLSSNVIRGWTANVRKLAYFVDYVMDKYSYEALKIREEGLLGFGSSRHIKVFSKIADDLVEIEVLIIHVIGLKSYWRNRVSRKQLGGLLPELVSDEDLVGIDENMSKLTDWVTTNEKECTVISVSGMGGLGKTTLVRNVYDRQKANFPDAHAWIVVSQEYDVVHLLTELLTKIQHTNQSPVVDTAVVDQADVFELKESIKKVLQDRKWLIVLDDMWDKEAYTKMHSAFQGLQGSKVMITTRKVDVAALAPPGRHLQLQPLGRADSFKLFCSRAFNYDNPDRKCPRELETVATTAVETCHGLPLAIVSCGRLFSTKQPTQDTWIKMCNYLRSELWGNNKHVQAILNLSYHDLPVDLRNCFLYCTLFCENQLMTRESLVWLWVAEGFVMKKDYNSLEEVAEGNLMELIGRNMLEVVERDELLRVSTCKMNVIVRYLALAIAKEERFGVADDGKMMHMGREVRRFSTSGWSDDFMTAEQGPKYPQLRTAMLLASTNDMLSSVLCGSSYLTVLELEDSRINQVPESIGNLFNLRYIGLRRTQVQSLPDSIDKLSNLETLDLRQTRIDKLPPGIVKVEKLRHLVADRFADEEQTEFPYSVGVEAPNMISNFQELQTLETVHASKDLALQLKKMKNLQTICIDKIDPSNSEEIFRTLSDMPLLSSLLLSASDEKATLSFQPLKPISNRLHRLTIRGGWASDTFSCPIFQGHGRNLKYLALSWCNTGTEDPLQLLACCLPTLTYLSLDRVSHEGILVLSAGYFPQLRTLVLKHMPDVKQLVIEEGAIPCIDGIYITALLGLNTVPRGIESLGSLTKLWMLDLHKEFKADWIRNNMNYKMKHVPELRA